MTREGPPGDQDQLLPVERLPEGAPLPRAPGGCLAAPHEVPAVPPGLLPQPAAPEVPREVETSSTTTSEPEAHNASRRSSLQEPAQEPEITESSRVCLLFLRMMLKLLPVAREAPAVVPDLPEGEPPPKAPRLDDGPPTRAPGTPLGRLLEAVHRGRSSLSGQENDPSSSSSAPPPRLQERSRSPVSSGR